MRKTIFCALAVAAAWAAGTSLAETPASVRHGREIAQRFCAKCHAIGMAGKSPYPSAPPLREIVAKGNIQNLEEALGEGIIVGHPAMPQFQFKPREVGALIAYLKSLSGRG